jgi:hypothetical protein
MTAANTMFSAPRRQVLRRSGADQSADDAAAMENPASPHEISPDQA